MTRETKRYSLKLYDQELMSFNLSYDRFANLNLAFMQERLQAR